MKNSLSIMQSHLTEYAIEAVLVGLFMASACFVGSLLEHIGSPVRHVVSSSLARRSIMGLAMGLMIMSAIYSPWGRRSGAHMNPAVTLTFFRLGKIAALDTVLYVLAQFGGGIAGVMLSLKILGPYLADPPVTYLVTEPGVAGNVVALLVEIGISFVIMMLVLTFSNSRRLAPYTGVVAGAAVLIFIIIASPISGMSMNPARSFASALAAHEWRGFWIYVVAPLTGMLAASQTYLLWRGYDRVYCAKLAHNVSNQCIFRCNHSAMVMGPQPRTDPDQQRKSLVDRNEKP